MFKRWMVWAFLFVLAGLLPAAPAASAQAQDHDQADAVYLDQTDEYTLMDDGKMKHRRFSRVRLLTRQAFNRYLGETFIVYNPRFQELKINRSVTFMADGTEVETTPNAFNEVLPRACGNAPQYMHLREMVVTHLGLEVGAEILLDYEIITSPEAFPFLMGEALFANRFAVEKKTVKVTVPAEVELKHQFLHCDSPAPAEAAQGNNKTYTWVLENLPMVPPEGMARPLADYKPLLVFSTCPSWNKAAELLNRRMAAVAWLHEAGEKKIAELKKAASNDMDLVRIINEFVSREVVRSGADPIDLGYQMTPAGETYDHAVGNELDRAVLMATMLRSAGLLAEPVLLSRHRAVAEEVPSWFQFDEVRIILFLEEDMKNYLYLSPSTIVGPVREDHMAGRTVFRPALLNFQIQAIPSAEESNSWVRAEMHLTLDEKNQLSGEAVLDLFGARNPYFTLIEDGSSWAQGRLKRLLPGADFKEVHPSMLSEDRSQFKGETGKPAPLKEEHGFLIYTIPSCPGGVDDMRVPVALTQRHTPLWLPGTVQEEVEVVIRLPENVEVVSKPMPVEIGNEAGRILCGVWVEEGLLHIMRRLVLRQCIEPEHYEAFRELIIAWKAEDARRVVFQSGE